MRLPPFSVILLFAVMVIAGMGLTPLLNVQFEPSVRQKNLSLSYSWGGASAKVIESEVTSKLEGVISSISGVKSVSSVSRKDGGTITITLKSKANIDAVRFEITSLIRRVYPKLPEGVSYPYINVSTLGTTTSPVLIYKVNSSLAVNKIEEYVENTIKKDLSLIKGVDLIEISGTAPYSIEVSFDPDILDNQGLTPDELLKAVNTYTSVRSIIGSADGMTVWLEPGSKNSSLGSVPVKYSGERIIRLEDVADIVVREQVPERYYRINGLNTINLAIYPEAGSNTIALCDQVKKRMDELSNGFPENFSTIIDQDESVRIKEELTKIIRRIAFSLVFLLAFVFIVTRSLRYLALITVTLIANIFIAFIFYYIFDIQIHYYSLAGITVSLGMIIDSCIIMVSHYGYFRDRKAFLAILAALLTTIGALSVIFFLPEDIKSNLGGFAAVIIINLSVSLLIALILVPALIDTWPVKGVNAKRSIASRRRTILFNRLYGKYISFGRSHRWIFILILILGFGLPVYKLPSEIRNEKNFFHKAYNKTIGSRFYQNNLKSVVEKSLGGSLRLFFTNTRLNYGGEPGYREKLIIRASLPDGCTVNQLNDIVVHMENYLSQFPQIELFTTTVSSYKSGVIEVTLKKEYEKSSFPLMLKPEIISKAIDFGGANWHVSGFDDNSFNNNITSSGYKNNRIQMTGYNYDLLYSYCQNSIKSLSLNPRVSDPCIYGNVGYGGEISPKNEYFIDFDHEKLLSLGITPDLAYYVLRKQLFEQGAGYLPGVDENVRIKLVSSKKGSFDVWNFENEYLNLGTGTLVRIPEIGTVEMRKSGNDIYKKDQQYILSVAYDFIGSYELSGRVLKREIARLNNEVLPIGFKAGNDSYYSPWGNTNYFWLIVIIIAIIYFICSVLFESLLQPLYIILLIPVSFIGLFLTFYLTGFSVDNGVSASLIMLSGISINAGVYVVNQYNILRKAEKRNRNSLSCYIKAFNLKIIPILLTIVSTILGLIPFLFDGKDETFWFSFAVGTMSGLLFSILGIIFILPVWKIK
jgi:multidrug efflux pump subunit AcrB